MTMAYYTQILDLGERVLVNKHASLSVQRFGDEEEESSLTLTLGANVIKPFTAVIYEFL
jgi:hypothetical protein